MNRRSHSQTFIIGLFWSVLILFGSSAMAQEWVAGEHYQVLDIPVQPANEAGIEVVEVFSYACVHCYAFDPMLDSWRGSQEDEVSFRRVPAIFNNTWAVLAQAFYAAEALKVTDGIHTPLFQAIHEQGLNVLDPEVMASLFNEYGGVAPDAFMPVYNSFAVRGRVQQADAHGRAYGVTGVPTMVVAGKYRVDGRMAGNNTNMLAVVDHLIALERADSGEPTTSE